MKSGNLNFLEPSGLPQACKGNALPFTFYFLKLISYFLSEMKKHLFRLLQLLALSSYLISLNTNNYKKITKLRRSYKCRGIKVIPDEEFSLRYFKIWITNLSHIDILNFRIKKKYMSDSDINWQRSCIANLYFESARLDGMWMFP